MLVSDFIAIGNKLFAIRKRYGMTQLDVAMAAGLAERTYADIERGSTNMRVATALKICEALHITPDEILTQDSPTQSARQEELLERLNACSAKDRETALSLLSVYLKSLE